MKKSIVYSAAVLVVSLLFYGCGSSDESASTSSKTADSKNKHSDHVHDDGDDSSGKGTSDGTSSDMSDMEKMKKGLAKLSPEDAASAEKQRLCPVSGDVLGMMGAPIQVDVDGQQVWICCKGCRKPLLEDPAKYLAKLKN